MGKQLWFRSSGAAVAAVAVAGLMAALVGGSAEAGPAAGSAGAAGRRLALSAEVRNAAVARAANQPPETAVASALSPRQLAGQRVIYAYSGLTPPARLLSLIRQGDVGGVIFFAANFESRSQFTTAVGQLEAANKAATNPARDYPLLLMTDQEGGSVRRLPGAPVESEKWIGSRGTASGRAYQAGQAGSGAAASLLSYGLNVNLAPVLDVYRAPGDFDDQFQRSYSTSPQVVSTLGADFIRAQQQDGVAATAKHFPGLGAATASQDTDLEPVAVGVSKTTLYRLFATTKSENPMFDNKELVIGKLEPGKSRTALNPARLKSTRSSPSRARIAAISSRSAPGRNHSL